MGKAVGGGLIGKLRDLDRVNLRAELSRDRRLDGCDIERGGRRENLPAHGLSSVTPMVRIPSDCRG